MAPRVVIDRNVLVAGLRGGGPASSAIAALRMCLTGAVVPLIGEPLFYEYESVIRRAAPFRGSRLTAAEREEFLDAFLSVCTWVRVYFGWRPNLRDEGDNHLIELAVAGGAVGIVTKNVRDFAGADLSFPNLRIWTPAAFLKDWKELSP